MRASLMLALGAAGALAAACAAMPYVDHDRDGWVETDEWTAYRSAAYSSWDTDRDGRIDQDEFRNCWYGGGFYAAEYYNRDYWNPYWTSFDANRDGWLSRDEYFSAQAWTMLDRNGNGRVDSTEWRWW